MLAYLMLLVISFTVSTFSNFCSCFTTLQTQMISSRLIVSQLQFSLNTKRVCLTYHAYCCGYIYLTAILSTVLFF
jgi:hypothetical protein